MQTISKLIVINLLIFIINDARHNMRMSGEELAAHLNRNNFLTNYGTEYQGGRGTYKLIKETWKWLNDDLQLKDEAAKVAKTYVQPDGSYAYELSGN